MHLTSILHHIKHEVGRYPEILSEMVIFKIIPEIDVQTGNDTKEAMK